MPLLVVLLKLLLAAFLVRLVAGRTSLGNRTLLGFFALGALLGPPACQAAVRFLDPYSAWGGSFLRNFAVHAITHALLLVPVVAWHFGRRIHVVASVADAFLAAFMTGLGYDAWSALHGAAHSGDAVWQVAWAPPFTFGTDAVTLAGSAWWCGLAALAMAATLRFTRNRRAAWIVTAATVAFFAAERTALARPADAPGAWLGSLTRHGRATAWFGLAALLLLAVAEHRWIHRLAGGKREVKVLSRWQELLNALAGGRFIELRALGRRMRLERAAEIARAEIAAGDRSPALATEAAWLEAEAGRPIDIGRRDVGLAEWMRKEPAQAAIAATCAVAVFLLPQFWNAADRWFWSVKLLHAPMPGPELGLLACALAGVIAWRLVTSAGAADTARDPDEVLGFLMEKSVLWTAAGLAIAALFYAPFEEISSFAGSVPAQIGAWVPGLERARVVTETLLIAALATGVALGRRREWLAAPARIRRPVAVHESLALARVGVIAWLSLVVFGVVQALMHRWLGGFLFNTFGVAGNSAGDLAGALLTGLFAWALTGVLLRMSERLEAFLTDPDAARTRAA